MTPCKHYFVDNCGQGFTVPCCALDNSIDQCRSIVGDVIYLIGVECSGDCAKCDIIKEFLEEETYEI